jgi:translation elongation factor EF-G
MSDPISPESMATIRKLFFARLAETNRDLIEAHIDLTIQITEQNHNAVLGVLVSVENRIQAMRTILIVFRECLEG